jgi:predicted DNA-binding transcriptional regulator AlpA
MGRIPPTYVQAEGGRAVTLSELRAALERRAAEAEAVGATAPVASVYRTVVAELDTISGEPARELRVAVEDRLLNAEEASKRLGVARRWLYRHAERLPFTRRLSAGILRFSLAGINKWLDAAQRRSASTAAGRTWRVP